MAAIERDRFEMRKPCPGCGGTVGFLTEVSGQDTVRCRACNRFCYNAPRTETGREARSVSTIHNGIRPGQRARILARDGARCVWCKADDRPLHVGHIVSVEAGLVYGLADDEINDDENLVAQCEECNLGLGAQPMPLRVAVVLLRARMSWRDRQGEKR